MDQPRSLLLPVLLSVLACALALAALLRGTGAPVAASSAPDPSALQLRELSAELADLKAELARVASARPEALSRESAAPQASVPPEVLQRLAALEASVAALEKQAKERAAKPPSDPRTAPDPRKLQLVATDPRTSEQEKLDALHALRGQKIDGQDALTHDVIQALLDMSERSQDENTREDVYRNLHGLKDFSLRDSMLRALAGDPSAKVRLKVAQDIDTFLPDAQVEAALKQAAANDADAGVRARAAATLAGKR